MVQVQVPETKSEVGLNVTSIALSSSRPMRRVGPGVAPGVANGKRLDPPSNEPAASLAYGVSSYESQAFERPFGRAFQTSGSAQQFDPRPTRCSIFCPQRVTSHPVPEPDVRRHGAVSWASFGGNGMFAQDYEDDVTRPRVKRTPFWAGEQGGCASVQEKGLTLVYPRHSMGLPYMPTLGCFWGSM